MLDNPKASPFSELDKPSTSASKCRKTNMHGAQLIAFSKRDRSIMSASTAFSNLNAWQLI
jgi:hypothetical protein